VDATDNRLQGKRRIVPAIGSTLGKNNWLNTSAAIAL
jgi:hypothetical protein